MLEPEAGPVVGAVLRELDDRVVEAVKADLEESGGSVEEVEGPIR